MKIKRWMLVLAALALIATASVGGTLSYIATNSNTVTNTFEPVQVSCEVSESIDEETRSKINIRIKNTSDTSVYIRVKLLPYWCNKDNDTIVAKSAWTPDFTLGTGWKLGDDGFYYYLAPVPPEDPDVKFDEKNPAAHANYTSVLIPSIELKQDNVTLARQALEIIASCIQAEPADAVTAAWSGDNGSVTGVDSETKNLQFGSN